MSFSALCRLVRLHGNRVRNLEDEESGDNDRTQGQNPSQSNVVVNENTGGNEIGLLQSIRSTPDRNKISFITTETSSDQSEESSEDIEDDSQSEESTTSVDNAHSLDIFHLGPEFTEIDLNESDEPEIRCKSGGENSGEHDDSGNSDGKNAELLDAMQFQSESDDCAEVSTENALEFSLSNTPIGHIEWYMQMITYLGVSSYRRAEYATLSGFQKFNLKVVFWLLSILAFLQTLFLMKKEAIGAYNSGNLVGCVRFGFAILPFFTRGFFVYLIAFCEEAVSVMLLHIRQMLSFQSDRGKQKQVSVLAVCTLAGTIFMTMFTVTFSYINFSKFSFREAFLIRSYDMSKNLFLWDASNYENITMDLFENHYLANFTESNIVLGTFSAVLDFCSILQTESIRDLLFLAPLVLLVSWKSFERRIIPQVLIHPNNVDSTELETCLQQYKILKLATDVTNETLGFVLKFVIMNNLLLYAYLFVQFLPDSKIDMRIVQSIVDVLKASTTFYLSLRLHRTNGNVKKWLRLLTTYKGRVDVFGILGMTIEAALDDLRDAPIGFGTEYFIINENFLVMFLTMVASIISLLVESV